jgi:DNA replication protein DnaC
LTDRLRELHLPAMRSDYESAAARARQELLSYERYLLGLAGRECESRRSDRIERQLRESRLFMEESLTTLDLKRLPQKAGRQVRSLLEGDFADRHEDALIFGNPGPGKAHVACAVGQELIRSGRRAMFATCGRMVQDLLAAKRDLKLREFLKKISRYEVLILDDIGYVHYSREEMEVPFSLLAERYEGGSVVLTSNLPFSGWESIFKDPMTTAAAIDRLVHHSVILELNVPSSRAEQAKKSRQAPPAATDPSKEGGLRASTGDR